MTAHRRHSELLALLCLVAAVSVVSRAKQAKFIWERTAYTPAGSNAVSSIWSGVNDAKHPATYVTGAYQQSLHIPRDGEKGTTLKSDSKNDRMWLARIKADGTWQKVLADVSEDTTSSSTPRDLVTNANTGVVYVAGEFSKTMSLGSTVRNKKGKPVRTPMKLTANNGGKTDGFIYALGSSGKHDFGAMNAVRIGGPGNDGIKAITAIPGDGLYVTGYFSGEVDFTPHPVNTPSGVAASELENFADARTSNWLYKDSETGSRATSRISTRISKASTPYSNAVAAKTSGKGGSVRDRDAPTTAAAPSNSSTTTMADTTTISKSNATMTTADMTTTVLSTTTPGTTAPADTSMTSGGSSSTSASTSTTGSLSSTSSSGPVVTNPIRKALGVRDIFVAKYSFDLQTLEWVVQGGGDKLDSKGTCARANAKMGVIAVAAHVGREQLGSDEYHFQSRWCKMADNQELVLLTFAADGTMESCQGVQGDGHDGQVSYFSEPKVAIGDGNNPAVYMVAGTDAVEIATSRQHYTTANNNPDDDRVYCAALFKWLYPADGGLLNYMNAKIIRGSETMFTPSVAAHTNPTGKPSVIVSGRFDDGLQLIVDPTTKIKTANKGESGLFFAKFDHKLDIANYQVIKEYTKAESVGGLVANIRTLPFGDTLVVGSISVKSEFVGLRGKKPPTPIFVAKLHDNSDLQLPRPAGGGVKKKSWLTATSVFMALLVLGGLAGVVVVFSHLRRRRSTSGGGEYGRVGLADIEIDVDLIN